MRGRVANLSLGGCLIHLGNGDGFRKGEAVEMTFCVRQLPVRVQGSVRQPHPGQAIGIEFTMLSERGKRQLRELIVELDEILRRQIEAMAPRR
jgi:c-di-GMP-binding flagellar brake protein YcgR